MEISVKLPNQLYQNVTAIAHAKKKSVASVIKNAVQKAVREESEILDRPMADCSDDEVLGVANMKMPVAENTRMSKLLSKQNAATITPLERNELEALLFVFQVGNLRKSQGIYEAVQRGLIKTPADLR
jgi:hypothetical protein